MLSFTALFQCGGPDAEKVKVTLLYEVICHWRSVEIPSTLKRKLLSTPRGLQSLKITIKRVYLIINIM